MPVCIIIAPYRDDVKRRLKGAFPMNRSKQNDFILKLCVAALMAALVAVSAQLQIKNVPAGPFGTQRFHLGNAMCALSGILLGPGWGGLASGIGSILFDLTNPEYIAEVPITFVTKGLYGVVSGLLFFKAFKGRYTYPALTVSTLCAAVTYIVLYLGKNVVYNGLLVQGFTLPVAAAAALAKAPSAIFNGLVAVVFAPILGIALYKGLKAAHLERMLAR